MKRKKGKMPEMARRSPSLAGEEKQPISSRHAHQGEARQGDTHYKTYESPSSHSLYKEGMQRAGGNKVMGHVGVSGSNPDYEGGTY
jgi:hypothetical protein